MFIFKLFVGSCWGSFLTYIAYCFIQQEKIKLRRSHCDFCRQQLRIKDLIPLFSYLFGRGKCAYCQQPISFSYFLLELSSALVFLSVKELSVYNILLLTLCSVLLVLAVVDYQTLHLPQVLLNGCLALAVLFNLSYCNFSWWELLLALLSSSGLMLAFNLAQKDCFGSGDIKLMAFISLALGNKTYSAMILACLGAGIVAAIMKYHKNYQGRYLAFAPFLVFGIIIKLLGIVSFV